MNLELLWSNISLIRKIDRKFMNHLILDTLKCVRWDKYLFDHEKISEIKSLIKKWDYSEQSWIKFVWSKNRVIGELTWDWNVFDHSLAQSRLIKKYWKYDLDFWHLKLEDYNSLRILWLIHDIWELWVWDIVYDNKSHDLFIEENEKTHWEQMLKKIFIWDDSELEKLLSIYSINFDKSHILNQMFKLYEKLSYIRWAICAFDNKDKIMNPQWLIHNVLKNQIEPLYMNISYPSVFNFLKDNCDNIELLFQYVDDSWFSDIIESNNAAYEKSKWLWYDGLKHFLEYSDLSE
jgi:hypothetical protein